MWKASRHATMTAGLAVALGTGAALAQGALAQLGLTEAAARKFVFEELSAPTSFGRRSEIAIAGTRAFYPLPPAVRGPAATALFAWARAYVSSPGFAKAYGDLRRSATPQEPLDETPTVDAEAKAQLDAMLAGIEQMKQMAATLEATERARVLEIAREQEAQLRSPESAQAVRATLEAERAERSAGVSSAARDANQRYPADPRQLFARRLREFLEATADANFSARTISLTGGADGIEFVHPADRARSWLWQLAVIAGPEATTAARASADAWLKEIAP